ncbi:hypothetical protein ACTG2V_22145 [Aeromonas sp. 74A]
MFNNIIFFNTMGHNFVKIESEEAAWNSGTAYEHGNKGHHHRERRLLPRSTSQLLQDIRPAHVGAGRDRPGR